MAENRGAPWPQYGELADEGTSSYHPVYRPSAGEEESRPSQGASFPGEAPQGTPSSFPPPPSTTFPGAGTAHGVPARLPSRTPSVLMLIGGLLISFVVAPLLMGALFFNIPEVRAAVYSARSVTQGTTVTVDASGGYLMQPQNTVSSCELTASDGSVHPMNALNGIWTMKELAAGDYTLTCTPELAGGLGMTGMDENTAGRVGLAPMGWASLVGVSGLVLAVWGGVKLRAVGRVRRQMQITQMLR